MPGVSGFFLQKMNTDKMSRVKRNNNHGRLPHEIDSDNLDSRRPLRKINNTSNYVHPFGDDEDNSSRNHFQKSSRNTPGRIRLSQIPHIDSSSEDELGERETMFPNAELSESRESISNETRLQEVVTMRVD